MNNFVVEFKLPGDDLFVRHGTNVVAKNSKEAISKVKPHIQNAQFLCAHKGVVMLYGKKWSTWDATLGAEYAPARK